MPHLIFLFWFEILRSVTAVSRDSVILYKNYKSNFLLEPVDVKCIDHSPDFASFSKDKEMKMACTAKLKAILSKQNKHNYTIIMGDFKIQTINP